MRKFTPLTGALALAVLWLYGCDSTNPTAPEFKESVGSTPLDAAAVHRLPAPVVVDFETPDLTGGPNTSYEVFEDPLTGVLFRAWDAPSHISVSLLRNNAGTSACVPPPDGSQQVLGTGNGVSAEAIEALFPVDIPPNRVVSARFQALVGTRVSIQLFDAEGNEVAYTEELIQDPAGVCAGNIGEPRGQVTVYASARAKVRRALFDVPTNTRWGGRVFVIDDVAIQPPRRNP